VKNSKYPSKYDRKFCLAIDNTGVISVCYKLPFFYWPLNILTGRVSLGYEKLLGVLHGKKGMGNPALDYKTCITGLFLLGVVYKEAHICYFVCDPLSNPKSKDCCF
jgi:hypothetical protein